jgi:hypothetical protein
MGETIRALSVARARVCDQEVHDTLARTRDLGLVTAMREHLGDAFVTAATGAEPAVMDEWCDGWLDLPRDVEERLRIIDTLFATFADHLVTHDDAVAWFATPNVALGGNTPAATLRAAPVPTEVAPVLLVAARASIA